MKSQVSLLIFTLVIVIGVGVSERPNADGGWWNPIKDPKDPHVKEIAEFAVSEHNKVAKTSLKLNSVLKGEKQVVAGVNYKLILSATDGSATGNYLTVVYDRPWEHFRILTEFRRLP